MTEIQTPLKESDIQKLKTGDSVALSGIIYTARDAAHKRFIALINEGKDLPFDIKDQVVYYTGPSPSRPGSVIGSCGPTTSSRMDPYTIPLLEKGLKGMIGKGERNADITDAIKKHGAVYFTAVGGCGALIAKTVKKSEVVAFPELGAEAVMRLEVENLPVIVVC